MNNQRAAELIQRQRRRWRSQESDGAIAHRAERVYFRASIICTLTSVAEAAVSAAFGQGVIAVVAAGFLASAAILYRHSRQFTQVLRLLPDSAAGGRSTWDGLTRSLQPTAAASSAFGGGEGFAALWLRRSLAPRRLWLREVVRQTNRECTTNSGIYLNLGRLLLADLGLPLSPHGRKHSRRVASSWRALQFSGRTTGASNSHQIPASHYDQSVYRSHRSDRTGRYFELAAPRKAPPRSCRTIPLSERRHRDRK